jgi:hypothetical protein
MSSPKLSQEFKKNCENIKKEYEYNEKKQMQLKKVLDKCKKESFKYGKKQDSIYDLLKIIKTENKKNVKDFIDLFPETGIKGVNYRKNHVFEALWMLCFFFELDDLTNLKTNRIFKNSIEHNEIMNITKKLLEGTKINESNKSGVADIYFEQFLKEKEKQDKEKIGKGSIKCKINEDNTNQYTLKDCKHEIVDISDVEYFTFSAKYFKKEKGARNYDIGNIEGKTRFVGKDKAKIILLVNDKDIVNNKLSRTKAQEIATRCYKVYGLDDLNKYYNILLNKLEKEEVDTFIHKTLKEKPSQTLQLRLHQQYFVDYTKNAIGKNNHKFMWGAVPRSGKSYMIAGLIKEHKPDDVIIIMGAVSETQSQFEKMFDDYKDFKDKYYIYNKRSKESTRKKLQNISFEKDIKNILLISIQQLWTDPSGNESIQQKKKVDQIFKNKNSERKKLVFFDEAHMGSKAQNNKVEDFMKENIFSQDDNKFPVIMVTATFGSPLLRYETAWNEKIQMLNWNYDYIQLMKQFGKESIKNLLLKNLKDEFNGEKKEKVFKDALEKYKKDYYLTDEQIGEQYEKYPELIILVPDLEQQKREQLTRGIERNENNSFINSHNVDMSRLFETESNKLKNKNSVITYRNYILKIVYENLLQTRFGFNVLEEQNTQLWFLPTTNLKYKEDKKKEEKEDDKEDKKKEEKEEKKFFQMYKSFAEILMEDPVFKQKFEILILTGSNKLLINELGETSKNDNNDSPFNIVQKAETCAYARGKSLIIFVGKMLRLGISLPCVDIALHFDPTKSVDVIYQSIFRVLTERDDKKRGFLVDLNKERFIQFMYDMNDYETKTSKQKSLESKKEKMISKLFLYNLNGINTYYDDTKKHTDLYNSLAKTLSVDNDENFSTKLINENGFKDFKGIIENKKLLTNIYKKLIKLGLNLKKLSKTSQKTKKSLYSRKDEGTQEPESDIEQSRKDEGTQEEEEGRLEEEEDEQPKPEDEDLKDKDKDIVLKNLYNWLISIFSIHILFNEDIQNEKDCDDKNMDKFIKALDKKITLEQIQHICKNETHILDCHIAKQLGLIFEQSKLEPNEQKIFKNQEEVNQHNIKLLHEYKTIFKESLYDKIGSIEKHELINIYCNIKNNFVMLNKNINRQSQIIKKDCENSNLFKKENENTESVQSGGGSIDLDKNVLELIRKYLTIRPEEKKLYGEVFTPIELICEMLDTLPKSVWSNKDLKWLDPANGIGNYPVVVYYKLMEGLKKAIPNYSERSKHIIEDMLYMVELNPVNVRVCKKIFKMIDSDATPNIKQADFLEWSKNTDEKFDIIMGNPPFQDTNTQGETKHGSGKLYPDFIEKGISLLKINGFLLFVTPNGWFGGSSSKTGKRLKLIKEKNLLKLKYTKGKTDNNLKNYFPGVGTGVLVFYLIQNNNKYTKTEVIDFNEPFNFYLKKFKFLPNIISKYSFSIFDKTLFKNNNKFEFIKDSKEFHEKIFNRKEKTTRSDNRDVVKKNKKTSEHKFEIFHTNEENLFSKHKNIFQNNKKILISQSSAFNPMYDNGELGFSQNVSSILVKNNKEANKIISILKSNLYTFLLKNIRYSVNITIFYLNYFPYPKDLKDNPTDEDIYKYYEITKEEQNFIENVVSKQDKSPKNKTRKATREEEDTNKSPKNKTRKREKSIKIPKCSDAHPPPPCPPGQYAKKQSRGIECCYKDPAKKQTKSKPKSPPKGGRKTRRKNVKNKIKTTRKKKHNKKPKLTRKRKNKSKLKSKSKSKGFFNIF